jgi:predicted DNA-binding transcriptional regulator YafY
VPSRFFERVGEALLRGAARLQLRYLTRGRGEVSEREVSPQRLVHYRNTWYLDAWCHRASGCAALRSTPSRTGQVLDEQGQGRAAEAGAGRDGRRLRHLRRRRRALGTLRFDAQAAQWASREEWHPSSRAAGWPDGSYELRCPTSTTPSW